MRKYITLKDANTINYKIFTYAQKLRSQDELKQEAKEFTDEIGNDYKQQLWLNVEVDEVLSVTTGFFKSTSSYNGKFDITYYMKVDEEVMEILNELPLSTYANNVRESVKKAGRMTEKQLKIMVIDLFDLRNRTHLLRSN